MIVTCVYVHVKPDMVEKFIEASALNQQEAVKEAGNFRFDFLQMSDDPCRFIFYEAYSSEDSAAAHKATPHYLKWRDTVAEMMAEPRKGVKYNMLQLVK